MSVKFFIVSLAGLAGAAIDISRTLGRPVEVLGVAGVSEAGISDHASNYVKFQLYGNDGTTLAWEYSTQTAAEGALAARDTVGNDPNPYGSSPGSDQDWEAGLDQSKLKYGANQPIRVAADHQGTGQVSDFQLTVFYRDASA